MFFRNQLSRKDDDDIVAKLREVQVKTVVFIC